MRIDHFLLSNSLIENIKSISINKKPRSKEKPSDHTPIELETIANAMEDYINYDDEKLNTELLFGGLSVADRVTSINNKIDSILYN